MDQIKARIYEITMKIQQLISNFRQSTLEGDEYVQKRQSLKHIKVVSKKNAHEWALFLPKFFVNIRKGISKERSVL